MSATFDFDFFAKNHLGYLSSTMPSVPAGVPDQVAQLRTIVVAYDAAIAAATDDKRLSSVGKGDAFDAAKASAEAGIDTWANAKTSGIDQQMAGLQSRLLAAANTGVPDPTPLQVQLMCARLAEFDAIENMGLYSNATDAEKRVIEAAVAALGRQPVRRNGSLTWQPLLDPELINASILARAERSVPDVADQLRTLQRIRNLFDTLAGEAKSLLRSGTTAEPVAR
jgi:hypothetical protein